MSNVKVKYFKYNHEIQENGQFSSPNVTDFSDLESAKKTYLSSQKYANPIESYQTILDGSQVLLPDISEGKYVGVWSTDISDDKGYFRDPVAIRVLSPQTLSLEGMVLTFDDKNGIYCIEMLVEWYLNGVKVKELNAFPTGAVWINEDHIAEFNEILFKFKRINMPKNRFKLWKMEFGKNFYWEGDNLKNIQIVQEIDIISTSLPSSTATVLLSDANKGLYFFEKNQPLYIYLNNDLKYSGEVVKASKKGNREWNVQCEDLLSNLAKKIFFGGIYKNKKAFELLSEIADVAGISFDIDIDFQDVSINGYIPYTNCRDAILQVAFAIGALVTMSDINTIKIFSRPKNISQQIGLERVMQGQMVRDIGDARFEITAHDYVESDEWVELYREEDLGKNHILVVFKEPIYSLSPQNIVIHKSGSNFVEISTKKGGVLNGKKYTIQRTSKVFGNPDAVRFVKINSATLVNSNNLDSIGNLCYNIIKNRTVVESNIIDGKHITGGEYYRYGQVKYGSAKYGSKSPKIVTYDMPTSVGDVVEVATQDLGNIQGMIARQSYRLNNGKIVKHSTIK